MTRFLVLSLALATAGVCVAWFVAQRRTLLEKITTLENLHHHLQALTPGEPDSSVQKVDRAKQSLRMARDALRWGMLGSAKRQAKLATADLHDVAQWLEWASEKRWHN